MKTLSSYVSGQWQAGSADLQTLVNPATEEAVAQTSTTGIDMAAAMRYCRDQGGPALRALTFAERAAALKALSKHIYAHREELIELAIENGGNTRSDAKFDIDGATATLSAYAAFGQALGSQREFLLDGTYETLTRNPRYAGRHILVPRRGLAVHINAYNFPAWGLAEKAAVAWLAGLPVVCKPATSTALLAWRIAQLIVESKLLPEGSLAFLAGSAGDLLNHLGPQDVLAFTGSGHTAATLRTHPRVVAGSVRVNVEADSLNAAILGEGCELGSDTWAMALNEIETDVRQKTGQKCTAIRRVFVPTNRADDLIEALKDRLSGVVVGNPREENVRMGPLVSRSQVEDVRAGIARLASVAMKVIGESKPTGLVATRDGQGYFVSPHIFRCDSPEALEVVHEREVFGPVVNIIPYESRAQLEPIIAAGQGGLVASLYTDDRDESQEMLLTLAPYHGRLTLGNAKVAEHSPGPGTVMPALIHGGPGRAGGGEELGGLRGLNFYMQRTAIQGYRPLLERAFAEPTAS